MDDYELELEDRHEESTQLRQRAASAPVDGSVASLESQLVAAKTALKLWRDYHEWLNLVNEGPLILAHTHGWRCPREHVEKGQAFRRWIDDAEKPLNGAG